MLPKSDQSGRLKNINMTPGNEHGRLLDSDDENEHENDAYDKQGVSFEEAIAKTGYGRFHYKLLALCGWALSSDAIEILSISFIIPPATCDLKLSDSAKGWLNSSVFLGMMIGGYLWGTLSDIQGRRATLLWSLAVNALGGLGSSFAQSYWLFLLMRIVSGIGVGGSMPVIFTYYCEFQPKDRRGSMISLLATFWMTGNIIAAAVAWIAIPHEYGVYTTGFVYNSWRIYLAICVLPSLTSALLFVLMPESPKFLMDKGKEFEALAVLKRVFSTNNPGKDVDSYYEVTHLDVALGAPLSPFFESHNSAGCCQKLATKARKFFRTTLELFKPPLTSVTVVMIIIFFTLSFGYYGLFLWFPELFKRVELYGGSPCSPAHKNISVLANETNFCSYDIKDDTIYLEGFLTAVSNLPGNIITFFFIDRIGRKPLLASSMVLSGVSVFMIWFVTNSKGTLIMSCLFSAISVIGWVVLDVLTAELFPTNVRSTASGVLTGVGRIASILGNLAFGLLVDTSCAIPMLLVAGLLSFGGLCSIKLPNYTKKDLL